MTYIVSLLALMPTVAVADITGVWRTEPDRKDYISHIEVRSCGGGYCGKVAQVFNANGDPIAVPSIGRVLFWDMKSKGEGVYGGGTAFVPLINLETRQVELQLEADTLRVEGRVGPLRGSQVWTRVD